LEDKDILVQFGNTNTRNSAFSELVKKYQERIYWHVRRIVIDHEDADDVVQEIFIKIYKNLEKFREASQLFTWMYRIATNESLTFIKKKQRQYMQSIDDVQHELVEKIQNGPYIDGNEIQRRLQEALLTLPDKQRLVFNMKYFENLKYDQIAEITGTSVGALKASYHLAVKKIENLLKQH
jgi:RNA polymerase sigma-70 factor, ECF subfamily